MPETADVVIIGGGIVGSSVAYHLTDAGCANVLVVEREQQQACGLTNAKMVTREDILKTVPQLIADDVLGGSFCPTDGFVDPYSVMTGFAKRARDRGAKVLLETDVTGINVEQGQVAGVQT